MCRCQCCRWSYYHLPGNVTPCHAKAAMRSQSREVSDDSDTKTLCCGRAMNCALCCTYAGCGVTPSAGSTYWTCCTFWIVHHSDQHNDSGSDSNTCDWSADVNIWQNAYHFELWSMSNDWPNHNSWTMQIPWTTCADTTTCTFKCRLRSGLEQLQVF